MPYGALFLGLGPPTRVRAFGNVPNARNFVVPLTVPTPSDFVLQAWALDVPLPSGHQPGNFSNPVSVRIE